MPKRNNAAKRDTSRIQERVSINKTSYPDKETIIGAMRDMERENQPVDSLELAAVFGITTAELEVILAG